MESLQIARREVYSRFAGQGRPNGDIVLAPAYARLESGIAVRQLEKPGVRLATVLNAALR